MTEPFLKWKLDDLLEREQVTVYALNQRLAEAGRSVSRTTLYRLASEQPERIDLEVAGRVLWGLEQLTGKHYDVSDLLEYDYQADMQADETKRLTAAGVPYTGDSETDWWLDNQPDILERVQRFEGGQTKLIPLKDIAAKYGVER
jgi:hypothetical protein